ncbi:hypothetical protein [Deinococcus arenicola]
MVHHRDGDSLNNAPGHLLFPELLSALQEQEGAGMLFAGIVTEG